MQIRWSPAAADDFSHIIEYIRQENPSAARRVAKTIYESAGSLKNFPYKGRAGHAGAAFDAASLPRGVPGAQRRGGNSKRHTRRTTVAARKLTEARTERNRSEDWQLLRYNPVSLESHP